MSNLQRLLKESWTLVEEEQDKLAGYFYARMFLKNPQIRELFPVQMDVQRARLLGAIVTAVQTVDDPDRFDDYLRALGQDHRKFQVQPDQYSVVGAALIEALRTFAGERWSPEYDQAWRDAYRVIAERMIKGAADDTTPPFWYAEVIAHERRGMDIGVMRVRPLQPLDYRAGQYLSLECNYHPRVWRVYSPANAPRPDGTIDFHVRSLGAGWVSGALVRRLKVGEMVRLASPMGSMTLDRGSTRDLVLIGGGTGLAPLKAIIEELTQYNRTRWVHLFFGARNRDDLYDLAELNQLAADNPWLSVVPAVIDEPNWSGESGNIADVAARYGPFDQHDFFVSGSGAMVKATLRKLSEMRVPSVRIKYDVFGEL